MPLLGYSIYQLYLPRLREDAFIDLRAIAALKSAQIEAWLAQREATANLLSKDTDLAQHAMQLTRNPTDERIRERILGRLNVIREVYGYDLLLLDVTGKPLLQTGSHVPIVPTLQALLSKPCKVVGCNAASFIETRRVIFIWIIWCHCAQTGPQEAQ